MSSIQYINDGVYLSNYFIYDGKSSADFRVVISGEQTWGSPERDVEEITVPGRNGSLFLDNGRYKNMDHPYTCTILDDWKNNYEAFKDFLISHTDTYYRLEDTYHPKVFMMAQVKSISDIAYDEWIGGGTFTVTFNRKPQRFLKSGEDPEIFIKNASNPNILYGMYNDTLHESKPIITVWGSGGIGTSDWAIRVNGNSSNNYITIDTETCEAYRGGTNMNKYVELPNKPAVIKPGINDFFVTVDKALIYPRWWML